jgi:hypothetical protein
MLCPHLILVDLGECVLDHGLDVAALLGLGQRPEVEDEVLERVRHRVHTDDRHESACAMSLLNIQHYCHC